jgi:hypothetical protein
LRVPDLRAVAVAARHGLDMPRADPLRFRRVSSPQVRTLLEHVAAGIEGYGHAGNAAAKTEEISALFLRMCRGQKGFDARLLPTREGDPPDPHYDDPYPIALPGFYDGEAWRHWVLVQSYAQAKDSSMRAYRKLLGRYPHKIGWLQRDQGTIKLIKVKPEIEGWSEDPETWSEITFISQENMTEEDVKYVQGARVHSAQFDEMGKEAVVREVRARRIANRPLYIAHGATPEYKHEWEWCYADFRECLLRVVRGRIRVQWSVWDNRALSREDVEARLQTYLQGDGSKSDLYDARVAGEHVDVSGACPFPRSALERVLVGCQAGRTETIELRSTPTNPWEDDYRDILPACAVIERWLPRKADHSYLLSVDTSRGIDDPAHDPCELQVWDWTEAMCVCRFGMRGALGGYLDEDSLAILADKLGREYGNALVDVEVAGNFGVQFIATLRKLRYPNLAHDDRTRAPGELSTQYGWNANPTTNGENVNALIKGLNEDSFMCWSADMVLQWMDVREDEQGRPANVRKGARHHREAMVCAGRALHIIQTKPAPRVMQARMANDFDAALRRDMGHPVHRPGRMNGTVTNRPQVWRPK